MCKSSDFIKIENLKLYEVLKTDGKLSEIL